MHRFPASGKVPSWFVVIPDTTKAAAPAAALARYAPDSVRHPSGRPWLLGRWDAEELALGTARDAKVAVIGTHDVDGETLSRRAAAAGQRGALDSLHAPGSYHAVESRRGHVTVHGSLLEMRRVFRARMEDGTELAASRADLLAWVLNRGIDDRGLAVQLLSPNIAYPLDLATVWDGIRSVPGHHRLRISPSGGAVEVRRWEPPEPSVPLGPGARNVREALFAAVEVRARRSGPFGCELGGVDSTSVCSVLSRTVSEVQAITMESLDPYDDDLVYAKRTVSALGNVRHRVLPSGEFPLYYDDMSPEQADFDGPFAGISALNRAKAVFQASAESGVKLHFGGYGGDELFHSNPAWVRHYLFRDPRRALPQLRAQRVQLRSPWRATLRQVLDTSSYRRWLRRSARSLHLPYPAPDTPQLDWWPIVPAPPWISPHALELLRETFRQALPDAVPLAPSHGMHGDLAYLRSTSRIVRQLAELACSNGLSLEAPYYDDAVVAAALSVRPQDRISKFRYKPLIAEAMKGVVPDASLSRSTKAEGSAGLVSGMQAHSIALADIFRNSLLAERGIIDGRRVARDIEHAKHSPLELGHQLHPVLGCELWLRSLDRETTDMEAGS